MKKELNATLSMDAKEENMSYQQIASKMRKTIPLLNSERVARYVPETVWLDEKNLILMIEKHSSIFIKPDRGGGGGGAIQIKKTGNDLYQCQSNYKTVILPLSQLYAWVQKNKRGERPYLIQKGIQLAKVDGGVIDLRINMQKPKNKWEITGIVGRIATKGKIVTNYCKGGKAVYASEVVKPIFVDNDAVDQCHQEIIQLSMDTAEVLNKRFKGLRELGIDLGIDTEKNLWIFEVNTRPRFRIFGKLSDPSILREIYRKHRIIMRCFR